MYQMRRMREGKGDSWDGSFEKTMFCVRRDAREPGRLASSISSSGPEVRGGENGDWINEDGGEEEDREGEKIVGMERVAVAEA